MSRLPRVLVVADDVDAVDGVDAVAVELRWEAAATTVHVVAAVDDSTTEIYQMHRHF